MSKDPYGLNVGPDASVPRKNSPAPSDEAISVVLLSRLVRIEEKLDRLLEPPSVSVGSEGGDIPIEPWPG